MPLIDFHAKSVTACHHSFVVQRFLSLPT